METLHIITCVSNPLHWATRTAHAQTAIAEWLKEPNVTVTVAECLFGSNCDYRFAEHADGDRVVHVPLRAHTAAWSKENMLNLALQRVGPEAHKVAFFDADAVYRRPGWATRILHTLDLYPVVQAWNQALDLGPQGQVLSTFQSFASIWHLGHPITPIGTRFWNDSRYNYPHPGYHWAWQRGVLDKIGGLYEHAGMGAADHTMAVGMVGKWRLGVQRDMPQGYMTSVGSWCDRAYAHIRGKIGFTHDVIEHPFHGKKANRAYQPRWEPFVRRGFDPNVDLKRNSYGVIEFAGNKPALELEWLNYLRARDEDTNSLN